MYAIDLLDAIFVDPELFQVDALVEASNAPDLVVAQKELSEHRQSIKLPDRLNIVASQPHLLQKPALF